MYLLDTNIIINFLDASFSPAAMQVLKNIVDDHCNVSIIAKIEALGFNFKTNAEQETMRFFINNSIILDINDEVANKTIIIRKSKKIGLPDAILQLQRLLILTP